MQEKQLEIAVVEDDDLAIRKYEVLHESGHKLDLFFTGDRYFKTIGKARESDKKFITKDNPFYSEVTLGTYDEIAKALTQSKYDLYLFDGLGGNLWELIEKAKLPEEKVVVTSDIYGYDATNRGIKTCRRDNLNNLFEILSV